MKRNDVLQKMWNFLKQISLNLTYQYGSSPWLILFTRNGKMDIKRTKIFLWISDWKIIRSTERFLQEKRQRSLLLKLFRAEELLENILLEQNYSEVLLRLWRQLSYQSLNWEIENTIWLLFLTCFMSYVPVILYLKIIIREPPSPTRDLENFWEILWSWYP